MKKETKNLYSIAKLIDFVNIVSSPEEIVRCIYDDPKSGGSKGKGQKIGLKAAQAGCDQLLMPINEEKVLMDILNELYNNEIFKTQIYSSVKKIIRLKICLGKIN